MRSATVFKYELRRLFFSREYLLLLAGSLLYGIVLLRGTVLYGVNYTAPFSPQTFGSYCASLSPVLFALLLLLCARQSRPSERAAEAIIGAAPMPVPLFRLLRYGAVALAFLLAAALPAAACMAFYRVVFDYAAFGPLLRLGAVLVLPPALLLFGGAMLWGGRRATAAYVLLAVVLVAGVFAVPVPEWLDLFGGSALQGSGELTLSSAFLIGRVLFLAAGLGMAALSLRPARRRGA